MKKKILAIAILAINLLGISIFCYLTIMRWIEQQGNNDSIIEYGNLSVIVFSNLTALLISLFLFFKVRADTIDIIESYPNLFHKHLIFLILIFCIMSILLFIYSFIVLINEKDLNPLWMLFFEIITTFIFGLNLHVIYYDMD